LKTASAAGEAVGAPIGVAFEWMLKATPTAAGGIVAQGTPGFDDATGPDT
jgi:hypothetical protein